VTTLPVNPTVPIIPSALNPCARVSTKRHRESHAADGSRLRVSRDDTGNPQVPLYHSTTQSFITERLKSASARGSRKPHAELL